MKIVSLDIETSPNLGYVWGLWDQNIGLPQLVDVTEMLCFCAKWMGDDNLIFHSKQTGKKEMVAAAWDVLDKADAVVHFNGKRFDIPHLNREFVEQGFTPPSPFKQIDLLQTVKRQFRLPSNKLEYVSRWLGLSGKLSHTGFELWLGCMRGDKKAWDLMERYNRQDVVLTEEAYSKLLPWIPSHPNPSNFDDTQELQCRCGSRNYNKEGFAYTQVGKYQQYSCKDCGSWFRGGKNLAVSKEVARNVV